MDALLVIDKPKGLVVHPASSWIAGGVLVVAGLVILDYGPLPGFTAGVQQLLPPDLASKYQAAVQQNYDRLASDKGPGGGLDIPGTVAEEQAAGPLPDVPLIDLVNAMPPNPAPYPAGWTDDLIAQAEQLRLDLDAAVVQGLPRAQYALLDNSEDGSNVYVTQRVTDAIVQVVDAARDQAAAAAGALP